MTEFVGFSQDFWDEHFAATRSSNNNPFLSDNLFDADKEAPPRTLPPVDLDSTALEFAMALGIDVVSFMRDPANDFYEPRDIDPIAASYGIYDSCNDLELISVADMLGHDKCVSFDRYGGRNILRTLKDFFERGSRSTYKIRALELLDYRSGEDFIRELKRRNDDTRDMRLTQMGDGKYLVTGNGIHRYSVLRVLYLRDKAKKEKSEEELRAIYTIPVTVECRLNFFRTYCNYIILKGNRDIEYIGFTTGVDSYCILYKSGERQTIDNNQLAILLQQSVDKLDVYDMYEITNNYNTIENFRLFVDTYLPSLTIRIFKEWEKKNNEVGRTF